MIRLEHVNKYFYKHKKNQIHVIKDTSITLDKTGLVSLLGNSGSGKTTLLNAIGGLDKVNSGKIYIDGKRITKKSSYTIDKIRNLDIGYIFQDYLLVDNLSVYDNVSLVLKMCGIKDKNEIKTRVDYVLKKVSMYRYRNRLANMLSGGERQRVAIARCIVKDPKIIIADEPTGNLDSKNTIEVMNIIKAISKTKLVILVTHERDLAEFYSSRILELEDGKIVKDRIVNHNDTLDYRLDNKIYLKDLKYQNNIQKDNLSIDYYGEDDNTINLKLVVVNGNIYIKTTSDKKIEVLDNSSNIELVDSHYKKISKEEYEKYEFNFDSIINKNIKKRYSSIFNIFTSIINGFKKVRDYSFIKKMLLLGFLASGIFIAYSISSLFGINNISDENFVTYNKNYLTADIKNVKVSDYLKYESDPNINYLLPGSSIATLKLKLNDYYQTSYSELYISGSLASINMINQDDLVLGVMPKNNREIVIDKMVYDNLIKNFDIKQAGVFSSRDLLNRTIYLDYNLNYKIVGITDQKSPSIYTFESEFINILYNKVSEYYYDEEKILVDYNLIKDDFKLVKGRLPKNDYEVIVSNDYNYMYELNKTMDYKVNDNKLKVVGYFTSSKYNDKYLVSNNTIKYDLIIRTENLTFYSKDKTKTLEDYKNTLNIKDSYDYSRTKYIEEKTDSFKSTITFSIIILLVSLIEIYLIIRSSFLSRIKEVGIYRAIGMKKTDIYKMFVGEIIAITTIASLPGILIMNYILYQLSFISLISDKFMVNLFTMLITILFVYIFNIIVGLLPVFKTLIKKPAQILSRNDI